MIRNKKIYFIVGSISSGKSAVVNILNQWGYFTIEADKIVHYLYKEKEVQDKISHYFGDEIIRNKEIDRQVLGNIIYNNESKKELLESIVHPLVLDEILETIKNYTGNVVFIEIPLYYKIEKLIQKHISNYKIISLEIDKEIQIERLMKRNRISREKALNLMYNIKDMMMFNKKVDYIIENNDDFSNLKEQINKILKLERLNEDN